MDSNPSSSLASPLVAIVGATGAVGVEMIRCLEERNFYPREAGGVSGVAVFGMMVDTDGRLASLTLFRSSGVRALDFAAEAAIRASAPFRPLPPDYESPAPITATIPVTP